MDRVYVWSSHGPHPPDTKTKFLKKSVNFTPLHAMAKTVESICRSTVRGTRTLILFFNTVASGNPGSRVAPSVAIDSAALIVLGHSEVCSPSTIVALAFRLHHPSWSSSRARGVQDRLREGCRRDQWSKTYFNPHRRDGSIYAILGIQRGVARDESRVWLCEQYIIR